MMNASEPTAAIGAKQSLEIRIPGACRCGTPITKILDSKRKTCRRDGIRFIYTDKSDLGWCIIRCEGCLRLIDDTWIPTGEAVVNG